MKKIVFVLPGIAGGGAEKFALNLYRAMETHKGYECHILTLSRNVAHEVDAACNLHFLDQASTISKKGLGRLTYRKKVVNIVDDYIDKEIGNNCFVLSNMMFVDKIMSLSRHKVYHIIHSAYAHSLLAGMPFYRKYFIKKNINNVYSHHPLVFVSEGALDSFCASFTANVDKYVVYNPANDLEINKLSEEEVINLNCDYIVHVGRFNRAKRHDRLLRAFSKIESNAKLLLLGDGKLESEINLLIDSLGLRDQVLLMGFKKNPYPYIKRAKALVLSSDFEGLPTVIVEACSLGVPVVATDCPGGIREIVKKASPSLVPLHDVDGFAAAIDDALQCPEKYKSSLDKKFKSQFVAEKYDNLFK